MPALLLLAGALGLNYHRHRHGRSTICSTCRRAVGPRAFLVGWAVLSLWLIPHYRRPFARAARAVLDTFDSEE